MNYNVSIIIPCWFTPDQHGKYGDHETFWFASHCLERLQHTVSGHNTEIIIVNNGSTLTDDNIKKKKDIPISVKEYWQIADVYIENRNNKGFAPACNQGFDAAKYEYVVCLNNDILVWNGWREAMLEVFEKDLLPPAGVVMPALMKETKDAREALAITEINLLSNYDRIGPRAEFGSFWMAPKHLLSKLKHEDGYIFDENFKIGFGEDRDLWDRIRLQGYETYRTHKTRVFHQGNMSMGKIKDRKKYTTKNREYLQEKRNKRSK